MPYKTPYSEWSEERKIRHRNNTKRWKKAHRDKHLEFKKKYYQTHKEQWKHNYKYKIGLKYGVTEEEFNRMRTEQEFKCKICGKHENDQVRRLSLDHDHKTGEIRGLLCDNCNVGLGNFQDSPEILQSAINYLQKNFENSFDCHIFASEEETKSK